jgi:hypothetical protein
VQVGGSGVSGKVRPQRLDHLIALESTTIAEREKLDEIRRTSVRPRVRREQGSADPDIEPAEESNGRVDHGASMLADRSVRKTQRKGIDPATCLVRASPLREHRLVTSFLELRDG